MTFWTKKDAPSWTGAAGSIAAAIVRSASTARA